MNKKELQKKSKSDLKRRITKKYRKDDAHKEIYKKEYHRVIYDTKCPICGSRIDENGMCACGAGGS
jgi:hypothetical protein